jgi:hypothetical protein
MSKQPPLFGPPDLESEEELELDLDLELETTEEFKARARARKAASPVSGRVRWRRRWTLLAVLVVAGLSALETGASWVQHSMAPTAASWQEAAAAVKARRKTGEPVLFAPLWVEPVGRLHLGSQLPLSLLTLSDIDRFHRVWQVSVRGARHRWLAGLEPQSSLDFGGINVALFRKPAQRVLFDFTARIEEATVERVGHDTIRCPWQDGRFRCDPARSWNWVGSHLAEVGHRPYRCIFAHPVDNHVMRIGFPAVSVGRRLVGYTGIDDFENAKRAEEPVFFKVFVGDRLLGAVTHENDWPWTRFSFDTSQNAGQTQPVRFEVTTTVAYARTFCFAAEMRE